MVSVFKTGMAVVIFFPKSSDEELGTDILSKGTKDKPKMLTLLCFLLQCETYRCYGLEPILSVLETDLCLGKRRRMIKTLFLPVLSFNFQLCLLLFSLPLQ